MKPRGPLMIEHRLIEKMLEVVRDQTSVIDRTNSIDPIFIDTTVDFIRTYADRTHHGKEEDIMFRVLITKSMGLEDQKIMEELVEEHKYARQVVAELVQAKKHYLEGNQQALQIVKEKLTVLVEFYPEHITKEDKVFFPNSEKHLTQQDQEDMLHEFWEFDRKMIHEKYQSVVGHLREGSVSPVLRS
jgi:hemerythrin-like domain-containing protein